MSDPEGLLDASTLLLPRIDDPSALPDEPLISAITLAKLSVGPLVTDDDAERARRLTHVQQAEAEFDTLPFDAAAARALGMVAASLRPPACGACAGHADRGDRDRQRFLALHLQPG